MIDERDMLDRDESVGQVINSMNANAPSFEERAAQRNAVNENMRVLGESVNRSREASENAFRAMEESRQESRIRDLERRQREIEFERTFDR